MFIRDGFLTLPNTLRIAYRMWTNDAECLTPEEEAPATDTDYNGTITSTDAAAMLAATARVSGPEGSRFNVLLLPDAGDNVASFTLLAPALLSALSSQSLAAPPARVCLLSLDYPGHGHSQWRPRCGTYAPAYLVDDVSLLLSSVLRWRECALVGHGDGARIAALLAASAALQVHHPMMANMPRFPALLACAMLDPFPYHTFRLPAAATAVGGGQAAAELYAAESTLQVQPGVLPRALAERKKLQRTRKQLFATFEEGQSRHTAQRSSSLGGAARICVLLLYVQQQ
jgi:pimeloyl-ACP methyl ester carboxylesterase